MNSGQALWNKAKHIIPGGGQLLSKRCERFLPDLWPAYYGRAQGCEVWDLDGNHYYDFAQMGVGSCILGYADPHVNAAVLDAVSRGSMCTLNSPEEVALASRLIQLHPWADMARFTRSGGEACAVAVRIARAFSAKGRVAFCGYHGWSDWYLAANLASDSVLDGHLLPGLAPAGLYRGLKESALPFHYNEPAELEALFQKYDDIGVVIMEPQRGNAPAKGFLEEVRRLTSRAGAVLIFDEVTSGFRMNLGGLHLIYGVEPDMAVFAKALGNGFPIAAVIGKRQVMDAAQSSFISSTTWTERIGFTAALATLEKIERENVPDKLVDYGNKISEGWRMLAQKHQLAVHIDGIPPLAHLQFCYDNALALQTLFAQEMLGLGYLAGAAVYTTLAYDDNIIAAYLEACDTVFGQIRSALSAGNVERQLRGRIIQPGFKRLT